jgi:3-dehydroquinate dehydratase-2
MPLPKILIANGVNLDLLGHRDPVHYGSKSLSEINTWIADQLKNRADLEFFQTNSEADYLERIWNNNAEGLILNPGAWTHTSLALADRLECIMKPKVEVHLSAIASRKEPIRHTSMIAPYCIESISGSKEMGYVLAADAIIDYIRKTKAKTS